MTTHSAPDDLDIEIDKIAHRILKNNEAIARSKTSEKTKATLREAISADCKILRGLIAKRATKGPK